MAAHNPEHLMELAIAQAHMALAHAEVPIGAVVADKNGHIIAAAHNSIERDKNPLAHAEMRVLSQALAQAAGQNQGKYLEGCTLAVTLEPCAMCMGAIAHARLATVIFGAYDVKSGGTVNGARVASFTHHKPEVLGGICENACADLLTSFFAGLRG